jgi:hypothetical protein
MGSVELNKYIPELDLEVKFDADIEEQDVGVGAYEFWGTKGVDVNVQPVAQNISFNEDEFTLVEVECIKEWIQRNEDSLIEELIKNYKF